MDDARLKRNKEKYKQRINSWWKTTTAQRRPDEVTRLQEEMKRDRERLFSVCRERADGLELADCIVRLVENTHAFAHYAGIRRGYKIGIAVGKDSSEEKIIRVIERKLDGTLTPTEICQVIDAYNSRFTDLKDPRRVYLIWPDLAKQTSRWADVASLPKVKNYLVRARERARQIHRIEGWKQLMQEHERNRK